MKGFRELSGWSVVEFTSQIWYIWVKLKLLLGRVEHLVSGSSKYSSISGELGLVENITKFYQWNNDHSVKRCLPILIMAGD